MKRFIAALRNPKNYFGSAAMAVIFTLIFHGGMDMWAEYTLIGYPVWAFCDVWFNLDGKDKK
jgi:hypothetical protein